ncbi:NlpC/P60 family protein, partial [Streptomyces sp. NPDC006668]|uniref:C40 family peptidase n=1 Tax=Streptomyces sp. NPDC006668 TaxID=3156903 RepID=UPI0033D95A9F
MTSATRTARARSRQHASFLAACLAVGLVLLATLMGRAGLAAHEAPAARPSAGRQVHRLPGTAPEPVSRTTPGHATKRPVHTVLLRPGDTLGALARQHGITVGALQRANHLGHSTLILAGHRLTIPTSGGGRRPHHSSPPTAPRPLGTAAVAFARSRLGTPYRFGGTGQGGYDCSGLVQAAWRAAGVPLPRTTSAQAHTGTRISRAALKPGDLVFTYGYGHVQLYAGKGHVIEAAHPGTRVRYALLPGAARVNAYVRVRGPSHTSKSSSKAIKTSYTRTASTGSARQLAAQVFGSQYTCAAHIITRESGWN